MREESFRKARAKYPIIDRAEASVRAILESYARTRGWEGITFSKGCFGDYERRERVGYRLLEDIKGKRNNPHWISLMLDLVDDPTGRTFELHGAVSANEDTLGKQLARATACKVVIKEFNAGSSWSDGEGTWSTPAYYSNRRTFKP